MSTNRLWKQFHIYTDERDQDQLLIEAVGPFLDEVIQSGLATRGYFLRGRLQKQLYLRLCFDTDAPWAEVPQQLLYDILQQRGLDTLVHHVEEVQYTGFADTQETVQGPAVQPLLEDFFSDTTEFLLTSLAEIKNNRKLLLQIAFDLMVAHVIAINQTLFLWMRHLPYPSSFVSYHSHADGFFIMSKNPQVTKKAFADRYMSLSSSMQERLAKLLQQLNQNGATASMISPPAQAWVWYINKYIQRVINEVSSGRLQFLSFIALGCALLNDTFSAMQSVDALRKCST